MEEGIESIWDRDKLSHVFPCSTLVYFNHKMGHNIKEVAERFDEITTNRAKFHLMRVVERSVILLYHLC